jgi:hypothetical protein
VCALSLSTYAGKSVKVCCQGCVEGVKKDQDKIFKKVTGK